jgi:DNA-binding SARP family transcriptional activator
MLTVEVLGQFDIRLDGQPIEIPTHTAQSLLAYLLLNRDAAHRRARLAGLFWPDTGESNARNNLRHALWRLRKAIGHDYLLTDNVSVTFDVNSDYWLDAAVLESTIDDERPVDELMEAVAVYDGELLPGFYDDWVVRERERLRAVFEEQSSRLLDRLVETRSWEAVLHWGEHWVALGQAPETAYRALMVAHAELGNQAGVAAIYQRCADSLRQDLDLEPSQETQVLHARLVSGERLFQISTNEAGRDRATHPEQRSGLPFQRVARLTPPAFLDERIEPRELDQSVFVQRERELSRLNGFLEAILAGRGQVVFVTGSAGRGKTSLVNEFSRRAQATHPELLVVTGHCNAYAGAGDPYLPFRDVMGMLTGAVEAKWMAGAITRLHAQRLWHALPETVQALLDAGPDLIDIFVAGAALMARAAAANPDGAEWQMRLQELAAQRRSGRKDLEQSFLFEQYASVLHRLGARHPLLIVLDDLQWADIASISLLFHLGRRIGSSRILIVGAYRPEEVALGWDGDRHPLQKVLGEFKRTFGDHWVELAQAEGSEGQRFVDVLLDAKPNRLDEEFRQGLYRQTVGHPLFTVELLRAMQARGDLIEDENGYSGPQCQDHEMRKLSIAIPAPM